MFTQAYVGQSRTQAVRCLVRAVIIILNKQSQNLVRCSVCDAKYTSPFIVKIMVKAQKNVSRLLEQWVKKLKCSGSSGIGLEQFSDINIGVDPSPVTCDGNSELYFDKVDSEVIHQLTKNKTSKHFEPRTVDIDDFTTVVVRLKNGLRNGYCEYYASEGTVESIKGEYRDGKMNGKAQVVFSEGNSIVGYFKDGFLHGFGRHFDEKGRLTFAGNHQNGVAVGFCWKIIRGGGSIVGYVDYEGRLTGDDIAYIYPDYKTVLHGTFNDGNLVQARESSVIDVIENEDGILVPVFAEPSGITHFR